MSETGILEDLLALDLEYRLTTAMRLNAGECDCAEYLTRRRNVLMTEILRRAHEQGDDPVDTFASFARKVHARHADRRDRGEGGR